MGPDGFCHQEKDKLAAGLPNSVAFSLFLNLSTNFLAGCMIGGCGRGSARFEGIEKPIFRSICFGFWTRHRSGAARATCDVHRETTAHEARSAARERIQSGVKTVVTNFPILCHTCKHRPSKIDCLPRSAVPSRYCQQKEFLFMYFTSN